MKTFIRSIVASPKQSHYDEKLQLQLDLSYINPRVIVCSGPVNSVIKSIYRTSIEDLVKFLNGNHGNNWRIWNFRGEGKGYSDEDVKGNVVYLPFPDHQPPTLKIIEETVRGIDDFLQQSSENVVVLHCKAGKGRSGTLCCAYFMYKHHFDAKKAIELYTTKRMKDFAGGGVTIKSQKRYLEYWGDCLSDRDLYSRAIRRRKGSTIGALTKGSPTKKNEKGVLYRILLNNPTSELKTKIQALKAIIQLNCYVPIGGDKKHEAGVEIHNLFDLTNEEDIDIEDNCIVVHPNQIFSSDFEDIQLMIQGTYYYWFNKSCESEKDQVCSSISFSWDEIDGYKGTEYRGTKLFESITISWLMT